MERKRLKKENNEEDSDCDDNDPLSQFDAQMALLEGKLMQAKQMASHNTTTLAAKHTEPPESNIKDISSSPEISAVKQEDKEEDVIVNAAQNKSNGDLHSSLLVNGEHKELIQDGSRHETLTHKVDQETTW